MKNLKEKFTKIVKKYFEEADPSEVKKGGNYFLIDGKWCYPIHGCDTIQLLLDDLNGLTEKE